MNLLLCNTTVKSVKCAALRRYTFLYLLFFCFMAFSETSLRRQSYLFDVNHCVYIRLDPKVIGSLVTKISDKDFENFHT